MITGIARDTERSVRVASVDAKNQGCEYYRQIFENHISGQFYDLQRHLLGILLSLNPIIRHVSPSVEATKDKKDQSIIESILWASMDNRLDSKSSEASKRRARI